MEPMEGKKPEAAPQTPKEFAEAENFNKGMDGIMIGILKKAKDENEQLGTDVVLVSDALASNLVDEWTTIYTAINELTDKKLVDKWIEEVVPESQFHNNRAAVENLVAILKYWHEEGVVGEQDCIRELAFTLERKLVENTHVLTDYKYE